MITTDINFNGIEIHKEDINMQKDILNNNITEWMGDYEQIDDILILGVRL